MGPGLGILRLGFQWLRVQIKAENACSLYTRNATGERNLIMTHCLVDWGLGANFSGFQVLKGFSLEGFAVEFSAYGI